MQGMYRKIAVFLLLSLMLAAIAWGSEDRLTSTGLAPAAEGKIITETDRNGNTSVEVTVKRLAKPESLAQAKQAYLVWVQPRGKEPELLGVLRVNENLEGSVKGSTTYPIFDVLITAEDNTQATVPSSSVVLKGSVARK
jgi:hypothetical protein